MKNLEFQIRLENLKPDNLIDERLERILKLAGEKLFWTCLKGKETLSICGNEEGNTEKAIPWLHHSTNHTIVLLSLYQIRSVAQSCSTLCDPMNRSMPGLPVHHQLPEFCLSETYHLLQQGLGSY